jgi:hypothetical protein
MSMDTDERFGAELRDRLTRLSAAIDIPTTLESRVRRRERERRNRGIVIRGVAGALAIGSMVWGVAALQNRGADDVASAPPPVVMRGVWPLVDADVVDQLDVDEALGSTYIRSYPSWAGALGVPDEYGDVSQVITIDVFDNGFIPPTLPPFGENAVPRRDDVLELGLTGATGLYLQVNGHTVALIGNDVDLMYSIIDLIQPDFERGYTIDGPLPGGLKEIDAPVRADDSDGPSVVFNTNDEGSIANLDVTESGALAAVGRSGPLLANAVTVGGRSGYVSAVGRQVTVALALDDTHAITISSDRLSTEALIALLEAITYTDRGEFEAYYGTGPSLVEGKIAPPIVAPPPTDSP